MINVLACITLEHNLGLVVLAAILCVAGTMTFVQLLRRAMGSTGHTRTAWVVMSAFALDTTVWCTHFIALLAYNAEMPVMIDPLLTMISLVMPMFGFFLAITLIMMNKSRAMTMLGATILGLCVSGLHYCGMMAYRVDGLVEWKLDYVVASVILSCMFTLAAGYMFSRAPNAKFNFATVALFSLGVISLHFTGMEAMEIIPLRLSEHALDEATFMALSMATAIAGFLVIATGAVSFFIDEGTRKDSYEKLLKMAMTDTMTGLPNRFSYMEELEAELETARQTQQHLAVICIDLNRFKDINDTFGHKAGDEVLKNVASAMNVGLKRGEFVARLGGDEFAAIKRYKDREELDTFVRKLEKACFTETTHELTKLVSGGSIGLACFPDDGVNIDSLRNNADLAMYRAKIHPTQITCCYESSMDEEVRLKREIAADLNRAIDNDELELHYQLQASVTTGKVSGMEALLRWTHPTHGPISPAVFIPIAEESNLIVRLGEWVLRRACADATQWKSEKKVAVNMSAIQLNQAELPKIIHQILIDTGLSPKRLEVELTETAILEDRDRALHVLRQIKALGVGVALDDFGTGYSSLEILRSFPFDKIKLDRFFMAEIETSNEAKALVRSVLLLGKSLAIPVLAEGVESEMQLSILRDEGCDEVQGFLLGRPEKLADVLARQDNQDTRKPKSVPEKSTKSAKVA